MSIKIEAASVNKEEGKLYVTISIHRQVAVPLTEFEQYKTNPFQPKPDFDDVEVIDHNSAVRLGEYEICGDWLADYEEEDSDDFPDEW